MAVALPLALDGALAGHQHQLEPQQLVEDQPPPGHLDRAHRLGRVDLVERPRAVGQVEPVAPLLRQRFDERAGALERLVHPLAQLPRRQPRLLRLRVERNDAARAVADQVDDRVRHLAAAPIGVELAEEDGLGALLQLRRPPRLVEERALQITRAVEDVDLDQWSSLPRAPRVHALHAGDHQRLHGYTWRLRDQNPRSLL